ncbi:MAG TPA: hypothetical protein VK213_13480 [Bacteroidales bacterium]|nr:hypothetical protein [Bacteroidales bacterium]
MPELNLIIRSFKGELTVSDIIQSSEIISKERDFLPTMNFLNDIQETEFQIKEEDIIEVINYYKTTSKVYARRKSVHLTKTPTQVIFGTLMNLYKNETLVELSVVSTLDAALLKLDLPPGKKTSIMDVLEKNRIKNQN